MTRAGHGPTRGQRRRLSSQRRREAIKRRDGPTCWLCGKDGADSIDHIIPLVRGGSNHPANLRLAHRVCNRDRYSPQPEEVVVRRILHDESLVSWYDAWSNLGTVPFPAYALRSECFRCGGNVERSNKENGICKDCVGVLVFIEENLGRTKSGQGALFLPRKAMPNPPKNTMKKHSKRINQRVKCDVCGEQRQVRLKAGRSVRFAERRAEGKPWICSRTCYEIRGSE